MRAAIDGIKKIPHPEKAAERLSRRTHRADPAHARSQGWRKTKQQDSFVWCVPLGGTTGFPGVFRYRYLWESRKANMPAPIPELSVVRLTHLFEHDGGKLPEGSVGTVVHGME